MKDMKRLILMATAACLATACQNSEADDPGPANDAADVSLRVVTQQPLAQQGTRAGFSQTVPDGTHQLNAVVWASSTSHNYDFAAVKRGGSKDNFMVANNAYVSFNSSTAKVDNSRFGFPVNGTSTPDVYMIGLAPAAWSDDPVTGYGWTRSRDGLTWTAKFNFKGCEDVMYAPEVSGYYGSDVPVLHFYHLLTWLRFKIVSTSEEAASAWGRIQCVKLTACRGLANVNDEVTVSVDNTPASLTEVEGKVRYSHSGTNDYLALFKTGTDDYFPQDPARGTATEYYANWYQLVYPKTGQTADDVAVEAAYALCPPVTAAGLDGSGDPTYEYTLTIDCDNRKNVQVPIDLMAGENTYYTGTTIGREFLITLKFSFGNVVANALSIQDWTTGAIINRQDVTDN